MNLNINLKNFFNQYKELIFILILGTILRLINLSHYPTFFVDEQLYTHRAWSWLNFEFIDMYPLDYDYDHPFLGWLLLSIFLKIIPGDLYIIKARNVMVLFSLMQIILLYLIALKFSNKKSAIITSSVYAFTNQFIKMSRMVLLDNVAIVFILLTILIMIGKSKHKWLLSAICFGLSLLVKETFGFFVFGFLYLIWVEIGDENTVIDHVSSSLVPENTRKKPNLKLFFKRSFFWILIVGFVFGLWFFYALLNNELYNQDFSYGLLPKILLQMSRGIFTPFWTAGGYFMTSTLYFWNDNPLIFITPVVITILGFIVYKKTKIIFRKNLVIIPICLSFILPYLVFLMRGAYSLYFYYIPIFSFISLMCSSIPFLFNWLVKRFPPKNHIFRPEKQNLSQIIYLIFLLMLVNLPFTFDYLRVDENQSIENANAWVRSNLTPEDVIITNCLFFSDLFEENYTQIYLYWRSTSFDHVFNETILRSNWRNIDYFILDQISYNILMSEPYQEELILYTALISSEIIQVYGSGDNRIIIYRVLND